jgi:hypothetical protein
MSFEGRSFTFIKRIVQLLKCFMSGSQAGKVIYGLDTVIHLQRIAPTPPNVGFVGASLSVSSYSGIRRCLNRSC